jgi:hypothetical protein
VAGSLAVLIALEGCEPGERALHRPTWTQLLDDLRGELAELDVLGL